MPRVQCRHCGRYGAVICGTSLGTARPLCAECQRGKARVETIVWWILFGTVVVLLFGGWPLVERGL